MMAGLLQTNDRIREESWREKKQTVMRFLQINANRCAAAVDLALATAANQDARYTLISEPHVASMRGSRWYVDNRCDAAIGYIGSNPKVTAMGTGDCFVWIKTLDVIVYSCYISPNISGDDFDKYVQNLGDNIRLFYLGILTRSHQCGAPM